MPRPLSAGQTFVSAMRWASGGHSVPPRPTHPLCADPEPAVSPPVRDRTPSRWRRTPAGSRPRPPPDGPSPASPPSLNNFPRTPPFAQSLRPSDKPRVRHAAAAHASPAPRLPPRKPPNRSAVTHFCEPKVTHFSPSMSGACLPGCRALRSLRWPPGARNGLVRERRFVPMGSREACRRASIDQTLPVGCWGASSLIRQRFSL